MPNPHYKTFQIQIKKGHRLFPYCQLMCQNAKNMFNTIFELPSGEGQERQSSQSVFQQKESPCDQYSPSGEATSRRRKNFQTINTVASPSFS